MDEVKLRRTKVAPPPTPPLEDGKASLEGGQPTPSPCSEGIEGGEIKREHCLHLLRQMLRIRPWRRNRLNYMAR
jgi:hypothetical protein